MRVEQTPRERDDLAERLMGLREVTATIPLTTPSRVRSRGEARRRHQAMATVTGCAVAVVAVVLLVGGLPGTDQAVAPPATQIAVTPTASARPTTPTTAGSPSAATALSLEAAREALRRARLDAERAKPGGNPDLILPHGKVDAALFLPPSAWGDLGLGRGSAVRWAQLYDWQGGVSLHECDPDDRSTGAVGILAIDAKSKSVGFQKVRDTGSESEARALFDRAVEAQGRCRGLIKAKPELYTDLSVKRYDTGDLGEGRTLDVVRLALTLRGEPAPSVDWMATGYTADGRFTVVTVFDKPSQAAVDAQTVIALGKAALDRMWAVP